MDLKKNHIILILLVTGIVILGTLVGVYAYRANSPACQQGFQLQNESQILQEKLKSNEKRCLEVEAQLQSCSNSSRDLKINLQEVTSQRDSLLSEQQKLKEENQDLAEKLKIAEAALQKEREKKHQQETSSALPGPRTYSLLLGLGLVITLLL